ncbi:hypothetical protein LJC46_01525 [Desulfovibrio sp. OttesenSCG-928-G15]|nr:hypothetical protein [Desulfovibrio sp. OttesenSCG-928-G15]
MKNRLPFVLVPWNEDFLSGLLRLALERTNGDISRAEFIFPHSRPRRYLALLIERHPKISRPLIMPGMHTVSSLFAKISGRVLGRPAINAGLLDRVGLLLECVREAFRHDDGETGVQSDFTPAPLPQLDDARRFFPWGVRLAALYDECFSQRTEAFDFLHMEEEVSPFAALLLARLGRIFSLYTEALRRKEWTTPGFDAYASAEWLVKKPLPQGILRPGNDHTLFIAGFHTLTRSEDIFFRHLWEQQGATVVLHADPALACPPHPRPTQARPVTYGPAEGKYGQKEHWSCRALAGWADDWQAHIELFQSGEEAAPPVIRYVSGFDLHSQLAVLEKELAPLADMPPAATPAAPPGHATGPNARRRPPSSRGRGSAGYGRCARPCVSRHGPSGRHPDRPAGQRPAYACFTSPAAGGHQHFHGLSAGPLSPVSPGRHPGPPAGKQAQGRILLARSCPPGAPPLPGHAGGCARSHATRGTDRHAGGLAAQKAREGPCPPATTSPA